MPIAAVLRQQIIRHQQHNIDHPPNTQTTQRQKLSHRGARLTQTKPVHTEKSQQNTVQQRRHEIVIRVPYARKTVAQERSIAVALDIRQHIAYDARTLDVLVAAAAKPDATVTEFIASCPIAPMVDGFVALEKVIG